MFYWFLWFYIHLRTPYKMRVCTAGKKNKYASVLPYRSDRTQYGGGIILFTREDILSKLLNVLIL